MRQNEPGLVRAIKELCNGTMGHHVTSHPTDINDKDKNIKNVSVKIF